ncbi:hypothetical protein [Carnobacterium sp.]|uniref:hypothetical protein n=1 Tax=Carnobacterium sp. TaxID=48221 RepID=UPI0028A7FD59|nr:hypothetical protein [Carnobacterium sp.]
MSEMGFMTEGYKAQAQSIVNANENGSYAENKKLFDYCLKHYPEALDKLFKVETASL